MVDAPPPLAEASMVDVLFGEVYMCGGQSNMEFAMPAITNATAEQQVANNFPSIRIFSVGHATASPTPLRDLQTVWEPWQVASNATICKDFSPSSHLFATFSAVCWIFGRTLSKRLSADGSVPAGLISNNWGGTKLEAWAPAATFRECDASSAFTPGDGPMFNAMIRPYAVGPMALAGFTWYQGEADTASEESAALYGCTFPSMITQWRDAFHSPTAYFGFVQLSTWCALPPASLPLLREAQMKALELPSVGYATNADHGLGCNIHPAAKQYVGERLALSALALQYGQSDVEWRSPSYESAAVSTTRTHGTATGVHTGAVVSVLVRLRDVSPAGLHTVHPYNYDPPMYGEALPVPVDCFGVFPVNATHNASMTSQCAWASLLLDGHGWLNASVSIGADGQSLLLSAELPPGHAAQSSSAAEGVAGGTATSMPAVLGSAYAWGPIPMMSAYDKGTALPVLAWNESLSGPWAWGGAAQVMQHTIRSA